jgi:hypothetical protein
MTRFLISQSDDPTGKVTQQGHTFIASVQQSANSMKKKKNALRRIAAVNGEPKIQTLQRQRQLSSQESDEVTPT